ncbi:pyridoxal phosphate-dependent aminotransferase [Micromonospora sp. NPDC049903]|uniref:pyridoxal phosphate-dependent aminotransferase n=1 Tax=Micromonospora sp. NPDC049903 TaxID=3364276 RepID=UPI00379DBD3F
MTAAREVGLDLLLGAGLTEQERIVAMTAAVDLGPGYPQLSLPTWLVDVLTDEATIRRTLAVDSLSPHRPDRMSWERELVAVVRGFLGIRDDAGIHGFVTFSGSAALDRAIRAALIEGGTLLTTNPSIDIATKMTVEDGAARVRYVASQPFVDELDLDEFRAAMREDIRAVLITSPQNPTGQVFSSATVDTLVDACLARRSVLIADQTFCLFPGAGGEPVPLLPNLAPPELDWICVWDTGKTFGLHEDKLGFIFCSASLSHRVMSRLNTLQFGVSRRLLAQFANILADPRVWQYLADLNRTVHRNARELAAALVDTGLRPVPPTAGSLMLLRLDDRLVMTETELSRFLLTAHGIGVVDFGSFVHAAVPGAVRDHRYLRVALARDPVVIDVAAARLRAALADLQR